MKKYVSAALVCISLLCLAQGAGAATAASIKPQLLLASLRAAGVDSQVLVSSDSEFSRSLYIPDLHGSTVTIGFPGSGLLQGRAFSLEIDGMVALVSFTREKRLQVAAGDSRIESVGAFGLVDCILGSVFDMVENILKNVANLNVVGIVAAVFTGVINILGCL